MAQKTIIFFPLETGIAHILRSLSVAEELQKRGCKVIFCLPKRKQGLFTNTPIHFTDIENYSTSDNMEILEKVREQKFLLSHTESELKILQKYRPDLAVVDYRISAFASCFSQNIPMAFITNTTGIPYETYLPNFFHLEPPFLKPFNALFTLFIKFIKNTVVIKPIVQIADKLSARHLDFKYDIHFIVPEDPKYLPLKEKAKNVSYVGHIKWSGFKQHVPPWLNKIDRKQKTIYLTFGGTGFHKSGLIALSESLLGLGYQVIISCSTIAKVEDFKKRPNLFVMPFVSLPLIAPSIDVVVCHGGYGTLIEAIELGIPFVALPFNPDQWLHSTRFAELGYGKTLIDNPLKFFISAVNFKWTEMEKMTKSIKIKQLLNCIQDVMKNKDYFRKNLAKYSTNSVNGSVKCADLLARLSTNSSHTSIQL